MIPIHTPWKPRDPWNNKKAEAKLSFQRVFYLRKFLCCKLLRGLFGNFWNLKLLRNKPRIPLWLQHDVKRSSRFSKLPSCYEGSGKPTSFSIYAAYYLVVNIWEKIIAILY